MALKTWQLLSELDRIFALENEGAGGVRILKAPRPPKLPSAGSCLANVKNEIREPQMMGLREEFSIDSYVRAREMEVCGSQETEYQWAASLRAFQWFMAGSRVGPGEGDEVISPVGPTRIQVPFLGFSQYHLVRLFSAAFRQQCSCWR